MDGVTVIRVVRQIRVIRCATTVQDPATTRLIINPQQPELPQPPPRNRNNRCLNSFVLLAIYTIGIGSIVIGSIHINDCKAEKMLPIGLVVFGGMLMVARLLNCVYDCRNICEEDSCEDVPGGLTLLNVLLCLAEFGMFIAVCYWTFSIDPTTKPEDSLLKNYCDYTLYKTSFYGCIIGLIFYGLPVFCGCCVFCCSSS